MPQITLIIIYICISLFAGFMSGMFGIGGGAVRIPLLNLAGLIPTLILAVIFVALSIVIPI
jgi:uncharacterized membrane protein YfcA